MIRRGLSWALAPTVVLACAPTAAQEGPGAPPPAERPSSEQFNCLPLGPTGRTLPNPNAAYICSQVDALRSDCELLRLRTDAPVMAVTHCVDWRPADVRPGVGGPANPAARSQSASGGSSGGGR